MTNSNATLATQNASRYLQQLCKHFAHKVQVDFTPDKGCVSFPFGDCHLIAAPDHLTLTAVAEAGDLERIERVIGDHLARFAFRETPTLKWQRAA